MWQDRPVGAIAFGVRHGRVAPGGDHPPVSEKSVQKFGENTPLGRPGQPAELAPAYVLLRL